MGVGIWFDRNIPEMRMKARPGLLRRENKEQVYWLAPRARPFTIGVR